ncbi:hypothetical protein JNUCC0626_08265 [Lentzea sp. JNUCC 0626]|uniref:hypothetical protein n=1 Tax=Lentzea sp. JNUCC 0626 TaxID=3367513 RepID=UPI00374A2760
MGTLVRPDRLNLAEHPSLNPVALLPTISVVPPVWRVPGYDRLIRQILNAFPGSVVETARPGVPPSAADVVTVPYDFRRVWSRRPSTCVMWSRRGCVT